MTGVRTSRRIVFQGLGGLGVALALAGCGGGDDDPTSAGSTDPASSAPPTNEPGSAEPTTGSSSSAPQGDVLVAAAEVPVGGGIVLLDDNLVVVQPVEGDFKAFSAACTHQGTPVEMDGAEMLCRTHGSRFALADGGVVTGPASAPLAEVGLTVADGQISLA